VQRQLNRGGYHAGPVDGLFGPRTEAAVLRFQRHEGLAHDGVVGPRTRARLAAAQRTHANGPEKAHNPQNPTTQKPGQGARKAPSAPPAPTATPDEDHGAFPVLAVLIATLGVLALALAARLYRGRGRGRRRRRRLERTAEGSAAEAPWVFEPHPPDSRARPPAPPRGGERAGPEHSAQRPRAWSVGGRRP
jgi:hypothetical protein